MCSMNTSDLELYYQDFENYSACDQDTSPDVPHGSMVLPVLYYMLFFLGLLGNSAVLWILLRHIKLKSMTDVCLLNLAVSDFLLAASLPLWAHNFQSVASCKLMTGVYQLGFYSGTLFVTLMSMDRYLAIVHAVAAMRARTLCHGIIASIIIWALSVVMVIPPVIFANLEIDPEDNSSECHPLYPEEWKDFWKIQRNLSENIVALFVCLPVMIFCYVQILIVLSKSRNSNKDKAVKLIFTIVCVFVMCWVPYNITVFLQTLELLEVLNSCEASQTISSTLGFAELIALFHCCLNPVIYAFVGEKYRKSLISVLTRCFCQNYQSRGAYSQRDTTEKETSNTPVRPEY